ncbi:alpha-L-fucosidase [Coraliomargarita algicola]|uniref:alpha-L-fucosidase n=1 Tax=Coraliomargarita algicola TaxID=3092156 RepID=A0ABZ0RHR0_9BACT|nr:alpha-L-fucosidase [Coraliomargarita sp. J2-16]WPJ95052.1 alpha-L-fucosidase [Coraliomargarita sp. J2-16]
MRPSYMQTKPSIDPELKLRSERVAEWYAPSRFGLFYHWGMFTGDGDSGANESNRPLYYDSIEAMEADAGDPDEVAKRLVKTATKTGAKYIIYTVFHTCDRFAIMYPTALDAFVYRSSVDYVGALIQEARKCDVKVILYLPGADPMHHIHSKGGPWLNEGVRDKASYAQMLEDVVTELWQLHGDAIAGFWLDGMMPETLKLPAYIHSLSQHLIVTINNEVLHNISETDMGTTEFLTGPCDPPYNRPSGLIKAHPKFGHILPPKRDYNEDIPTCNGWWHQRNAPFQDKISALPYPKEPHFWVKEMVSSLGQRGIWNYVMGIGPLITGEVPPAYQEMMDAMQRFMSWGSESIYDTVGGEISGFQPGWWNNGSFGSVTVSTKDPRISYLHITTAPSTSILRVPHNGVEVASVTDLRTKRELKFKALGCLDVEDIDWSEFDEFGHIVLKVVCS